MAGLHEQLAALMPLSQSAAVAEHQSSSCPMQQQQQQLSGAMQWRIQHNIQLAARSAKLETEKQQLAREKADMQGEHARRLPEASVTYRCDQSSQVSRRTHNKSSPLLARRCFTVLSHRCAEAPRLT